MSNEIVRVKKIENTNGTYYIPQARKWVTRWLSESGYEWVSFSLMNDPCSGRYFKFKKHLFDVHLQFGSDFKGIEGLRLASYYCEEYLRVHHGDEVVKVWSKGL